MSSRIFYPSIALLVIAAALVTPAQAREPVDLIPADALLCWQGRPLPDLDPPSDQPSTLQTLLELSTRVVGTARGSLDAGTQLGLRSAEMFNLMIRYPHALALIDTSARPADTDPTAKRVDHLQFALVVRNDGHREPFLRIIQKAVNDQTDSESATLVTKRHAGWSYQELRDTRLPDWSVLAWGHIDDCFVFTVGSGVWPGIADVAAEAAPSLARNPWYAAARRNPNPGLLIEIFVAAESIQQRLDPLLDDRASSFFSAWDAGTLRRAHWALGLEGRALFCIAHFDFPNGTIRRQYADPSKSYPVLMTAVPDAARYAVYELPVDRFIRRFFSGLVAIQGEKQRAILDRIWTEAERSYGLDIEGDLLTHLGTRVVLHNQPPHPLRLPFAVTTLIEIRSGADDVRRAIDALFGAFQDAIERSIAEGNDPPAWMLHRAADGVWCLQFGLFAGPAWTVTDRFIVLSWSPRALREYLASTPAATSRPADSDQ